MTIKIIIDDHPIGQLDATLATIIIMTSHNVGDNLCNLNYKLFKFQYICGIIVDCKERRQ